MKAHVVRQGLRVPLAGAPEQRIEDAPEPRRLALLGADDRGLRPRVHVEAGDRVRRGQLLLEDRRAGVRHASPSSGVIEAVHRGDRRALLSVVVARDPEDLAGEEHGEPVPSFTGAPASALDRAAVTQLLLDSGLWTALRERPFGHAANPARPPRSLFVTAMDTHPLAADPAVVLAGREAEFEEGLVALSHLSDGPVFVCRAAGSGVPVPSGEPFRCEDFSGPHPAGTAGLHVHLLDPVTRDRRVWQIDYQDVLALGRLVHQGTLPVERVVSLAGPGVKRPRLLRTRLGASIGDLVDGELEEGELRVISGSVLDGRSAGGDVTGYLGRHERQISVLREDRRREFLGWLRPGWDLTSTTGAVTGALSRRPRALGTSLHGSARAIVPLDTYERVLPWDLLATPLLKALAVGDLERAEELGCLELLEEDLAACTYACPGKIDHGLNLRLVLDALAREG